MADKKITDLQLSGALDGDENLPIDDTIQTYRATVNQIKNYVLSQGGILGSVQIFESSGTWTKPDGCKSVLVMVQGAGGGASGLGSNSGQSTVGGGGGGGGYVEKFIDTGLGETETVTVGAGGAGGASNGAPGATGGTSSFGSHATATGGTGGASLASGTIADRGGAPGSGGGGTVTDGILIPGESAQWGHRIAAAKYIGANGGSSHLGTGGRGNSAGSAGSAGTGYGGGGGGGTGYNGNNFVGAVGADGAVIVYEFY